MDTNLKGAFFMTQAMARHLIAAGRPGLIISIASTHGIVALEERLAYGVAKAGVMHMTRMLAYEWAAHGIRLNAVAPGRVNRLARGRRSPMPPSANGCSPACRSSASRRRAK